MPGFLIYKTISMTKQLTLCRYTGLVEPVWNYVPKTRRWAHHAVLLHNQDIIAQGGDLDKEFWFLREKIGAKIHVFTMTADHEFIKDDPLMLELLGESKSEDDKNGSAQNRKTPDNHGRIQLE